MGLENAPSDSLEAVINRATEDRKDLATEILADYVDKKAEEKPDSLLWRLAKMIFGRRSKKEERFEITPQEQKEWESLPEQDEVSDQPPETVSGRVDTGRKMAIFGRNNAEVQKQLVSIDFLGRRVSVHRKIAPHLKKVAKAIRDHERKHGITPGWQPTDVQCQNWRKIRGMPDLSNHAFGIALDFDPQHNGLTYDQIESGKNTTIPPYVVTAFQAHGFNWGGNYSKRKDPMHFEPSDRLMNQLA